MDAARGLRADVDDRSGFLLHHDRQHREAAPERREKGALELLMHLLLGVEMKRLDPDGAADVVDQHVDTAEALDCKRHQLLRAGERADVDDGGGSVDTVLLQLLDDPCGCRLYAVGDHDLAAFLPETPGGGAADSLSRARDDADLVLQPRLNTVSGILNCVPVAESLSLKISRMRGSSSG